VQTPVLVNASEILAVPCSKNASETCYEVTDGWLANRMARETALRGALSQCLQSLPPR
jgi:hypothetical protein